MTASRALRRREVKEQQRLAAERLNEEKRNEAVTQFQQKYSKCTDNLLAQHGTTSNMVSIALLNAAEEITQKLLRDSNVIAKKMDQNTIEPNDIHFASSNLYKAKDKKRDDQANKAINAQKIPPISNTALHYGPIQKILITPTTYAEPSMPKQIQSAHSSQLSQKVENLSQS